jgi:hypothetical protein
MPFLAYGPCLTGLGAQVVGITGVALCGLREGLGNGFGGAVGAGSIGFSCFVLGSRVAGCPLGSLG